MFRSSRHIGFLSSSISTLSVVCLVLLVSANTMAAPLYAIKDITPAGYTGGVAYDVNSDGDAVGIASRFVSGAFEEAYFYYDHSADVSTVFGVGSVIPRSAIFTGNSFRRAAINDSGFVSGTAKFVGGAAETRGFIYNGTTISSLGTFYFGPGTGSNIRPTSDSTDINNSGIAVGTASSGAANSDNVDIYTGSSAPISDIDGDFTVATKSDVGVAINDSGLVAGKNEANRATLFSGPGETVLLAGTSLASQGSVATDVNNSGQATGSAISNSFLYESSDGSVTILPQIGTGGRMFAKAINASGDVVGWGDRDGSLSGQNRGFIYDYSDATSYILEDHLTTKSTSDVGISDWSLVRTAWGVNDSGMVVGTADRRIGASTHFTGRAFLLIPTSDGDANGDGSVDLADLNILGANWGLAGATYLDGDFDQDGTVGLSDLNILGANWSASTTSTLALASAPSASVPEPSALGLALLGLAGIYRRACR